MLHVLQMLRGVGDDGVKPQCCHVSASRGMLAVTAAVLRIRRIAVLSELATRPALAQYKQLHLSHTTLTASGQLAYHVHAFLERSGWIQ